MKVSYPVAVDSAYKIWKAFNNQYWPAHYFIDCKGRIRYHHFGEGVYDESERVIQQLLKGNGAQVSSLGAINVPGTGTEAAPDSADVRSPETYLGYHRAEHFASTEPIAQDSKLMRIRHNTDSRSIGEALGGSWKVGREERAVLQTAPGKIIFRFHARDLHLVLGTTQEGKLVRFRVRLDGTPPGGDHGVDTDDNGSGTVQDHRLYQLIRQRDLWKTEPLRLNSSMQACRRLRSRLADLLIGASMLASRFRLINARATLSSSLRRCAVPRGLRD